MRCCAQWRMRSQSAGATATCASAKSRNRTTSYDTALERAFDDERQPFDLAVFLADGPHRTRFLHIPWWDGGLSAPRVITAPNEYLRFPVHDDDALVRTIIVKIHGGALHDA